jgi:hypothetical protein
MPEISDDEYNRLLGRAQVADFSESIFNDPQLGKHAKALIKAKYPHVQIPDYDIEQRFNARLDQDRKERDDAERARKDAEGEAAWKQNRTRVQKEYGFTDDGMKDLESFMIEKQVGDYDVAATYKAAKNPKPSETHYANGLWEHQKQDQFKEISADPEGWARKEILSALRRDEENQKGQWR